MIQIVEYQNWDRTSHILPFGRIYRLWKLNERSIEYSYLVIIRLPATNSCQVKNAWFHSEIWTISFDERTWCLSSQYAKRGEKIIAANEREKGQCDSCGTKRSFNWSSRPSPLPVEWKYPLRDEYAAPRRNLPPRGTEGSDWIASGLAPRVGEFQSIPVIRQTISSKIRAVRKLKLLFGFDIRCLCYICFLPIFWMSFITVCNRERLLLDIASPDLGCFHFAVFWTRGHHDRSDLCISQMIYNDQLHNWSC